MTYNLFFSYQDNISSWLLVMVSEDIVSHGLKLLGLIKNEDKE